MVYKQQMFLSSGDWRVQDGSAGRSVSSNESMLGVHEMLSSVSHERRKGALWGSGI